MFIAILDYVVGEVVIKEVPKDFEELDGDDILTSMGYNMSDTCYMITEHELPISINIRGCSSNITLN